MATDVKTELVEIRGNTYPVRVQLAELGKWSAIKKAWMVPADKAELARALVLSAGPKRYVKARYSGGGYSFAPRCRCEDYPCCGC